MPSLPTVATTNCHKHSGLKWHIYDLSYVRSEVQYGSHWTKIKEPVSSVPFWRLLEKIILSLIHVLGRIQFPVAVQLQCCFLADFWSLPHSLAHGSLPPSSKPSSLLTHFTLWLELRNTVCVCLCVCLVAQSCLTLCNLVDYSLWGSSVHGILQARILEWVNMPSSRGSPLPKDQTCVS